VQHLNRYKSIIDKIFNYSAMNVEEWRYGCYDTFPETQQHFSTKLYTEYICIVCKYINKLVMPSVRFQTEKPNRNVKNRTKPTFS